MVIIFLLYIFTGWFSWYALKEPEQINESRKIKWGFRILTFIYIFLALGPLMANDSTSRGMYHIFFIWPALYAVLWKDIIKKIFSRFFKSLVGTCVAIFFILLPMEAFLAFDYIRTGYVQDYGVEKFISYTSGTAIFQHLWVYIGLYFGFALVVVLYGIRKGITPRQGFLVGGLLGVAVEQQFLIPTLLFSGNIPTLLILGPWTFLIYGWYIAGPLLLLYESKKPLSSPTKKQLWIFSILFFLIPFIFWFVWTRFIGWQTG